MESIAVWVQLTDYFLGQRSVRASRSKRDDDLIPRASRGWSGGRPRLSQSRVRLMSSSSWPNRERTTDFEVFGATGERAHAAIIYISQHLTRPMPRDSPS